MLFQMKRKKQKSNSEESLWNSISAVFLLELPDRENFPS